MALPQYTLPAPPPCWTCVLGDDHLMLECPICPAPFSYVDASGPASDAGIHKFSTVKLFSRPVPSHGSPGVRCPTCLISGRESWVLPGRACGYCGTAVENENKHFIDDSVCYRGNFH
ncbi:hypothetical protein BGZ63DRAFT_421588 [Mariannaea sp. PMI_226]|nr:hypothetical protein BGZ63DRAFT_421588 [Mariannaea sp. PMI_226]